MTILSDVKTSLGVSDGAFDQDLLTIIRSELASLVQMGVNSLALQDVGLETQWPAIEPLPTSVVSLYKTILTYRVKKVFDPPSNTTLFNSLEKTLSEYEFRLDTFLSALETEVVFIPEDVTEYEFLQAVYTKFIAANNGDVLTKDAGAPEWQAGVSGGGIVDAPSDGGHYGRLNAAWVTLQNYLTANAAAGRGWLSAAALGGNTFTGDQNLGGNALANYRVSEVAASISGTYQIDLSAATLFILTITGNVTVTFANAPASPRVASVTVFTIQNATGGHSVTFTGAMWHNGSVPDLAKEAGVETDLSFVIRSSGTDIRGYVAAENMS